MTKFNQSTPGFLPRKVTDLKFAQFDFVVRSTGPAGIHFFPGDLIHGSIGKALFDLDCRFVVPRCESCDARGVCSYVRLFKPVGKDNGPVRPPAPLVLQIPPPYGNEFQIKLVVFKPDRRSIATLLAAVKLAASRGFGISESRFELSPDPLELDLSSLIQNRTRLLSKFIDQRLQQAKTARAVELHFLTPTRIVKNGVVLDVLDSTTLVKAARRKLHLLLKFYGDTTHFGSFDLSSLVAPVNSVQLKIQNQRLRIVRITRRTSRQNKLKEPFGLTGKALLLHPARTELAQLIAAEVTNLGKMSTFGFGTVRILPVHDSYE